MAGPAKREVRRFHRVAVQRFEDAEILLKNERTTGAMYLAGYAVECGLKALLLASVPSAGQAKILESFSGKIGHDLERLKQELRGRGVTFPGEVAKDFRRVNTWSTSLRYLPGKQDTDKTQTFLEAAARLLSWAAGKL